MTNTLVAKIAKASHAVGALSTDKENKSQGYFYISADKILQRAGDALSDIGVVIMPSITGEAVRETSYSDNYGKTKTRHDATVIFEMLISDGESEMKAAWVGRGSDFSVPDKALYKAITSGHKYFLAKLLNIGVGNEDGEHDDSDAESAPPPVHQAVTRPPQKAPARTQGQNGTARPSQQQAAPTAPENPFDDGQIVSQACTERSECDGPAHEGTPPHKHFWGQGLRTFGEEWKQARPWLLGKYTEKTTPRNIRSSAADLSDDEKTQIAEYMRDNEVALQKAWERQKKINAEREASNGE